MKFEFIVTSRRERASRRLAVATCMVWLRMAQVLYKRHGTTPNTSLVTCSTLPGWARLAQWSTELNSVPEGFYHWRPPSL